jgi:hypothetical protein
MANIIYGKGDCIENAIYAPKYFPIAIVLHKHFKDKYICTSIVNNTWYKKKHGSWHDINNIEVSKIFTEFLYDTYFALETKVFYLIKNNCPEHPEQETWKKRFSALQYITSHVKIKWEKKIMREAKELFYEHNFTVQSEGVN